jgi:hypothetical protein
VIVEEVERLRWRLWNGNAKDAQISTGRIRKVMHAFRGELGESKIRCAITQALDRLGQVGRLSLRSEQMAGQLRRTSSRRLARRDGAHRSDGEFPGEPNKSQQMRWTRRGADLPLQVRCAVYNGTLGSGFGQWFEPPVGLPSEIPMAA